MDLFMFDIQHGLHRSPIKLVKLSSTMIKEFFLARVNCNRYADVVCCLRSTKVIRICIFRSWTLKRLSMHIYTYSMTIMNIVHRICCSPDRTFYHVFTLQYRNKNFIWIQTITMTLTATNLELTAGNLQQFGTNT